MPIKRLILILLAVIAAAGLTIFLAMFLAVNLNVGGAGVWLLILPIAMVMYVGLRTLIARGDD